MLLKRSSDVSLRKRGIKAGLRSNSPDAWYQCWVVLHGTLLFMYRHGTVLGVPLGEPYCFIQTEKCQISSNSLSQLASRFRFGFSLIPFDGSDNQTQFLTTSVEARNTWMSVILISNISCTREAYPESEGSLSQS